MAMIDSHRPHVVVIVTIGIVVFSIGAARLIIGDGNCELLDNFEKYDAG